MYQGIRRKTKAPQRFSKHVGVLQIAEKRDESKSCFTALKMLNNSPGEPLGERCLFLSTDAVFGVDICM